MVPDRYSWVMLRLGIPPLWGVWICWQFGTEPESFKARILILNPHTHKRQRRSSPEAGTVFVFKQTSAILTMWSMCVDVCKWLWGRFKAQSIYFSMRSALVSTQWWGIMNSQRRRFMDHWNVYAELIVYYYHCLWIGRINKVVLCFQWIKELTVSTSLQCGPG